MRKVNLNNLYESPLPPTSTNVLWVTMITKEEVPGTLGQIGSIKEFNSHTGEWETILVNYKDIMHQIENLNTQE